MAVTIPGVPTLNATTLSTPAQDAFNITVGTTFNAWARGVWVGVGGNVEVVFPSGSSIVFLNVPTGYLLPVVCGRIATAGTTATNLVGLV